VRDALDPWWATSDTTKTLVRKRKHAYPTASAVSTKDQFEPLGKRKSHLEQGQHASLPSQHKRVIWMEYKRVESQEGKEEGALTRTIVKTRGNAPWRRDWRRG
jgi:hypothetical protein